MSAVTGPPQGPQYEDALVDLGRLLGALADERVFGWIKSAVREGSIHRGYVERLRDLLAALLEE